MNHKNAGRGGADKSAHHFGGGSEKNEHGIFHLHQPSPPIINDRSLGNMLCFQKRFYCRGVVWGANI
jgi:hypothetical protein